MDANPTEEAIKKLQVMITNFLIIDDGTLRLDVNLREYGMDAGADVNDTTVQELCAVHPTLTRLDLTSCSEVTDVGVWSVARHCIAIKSLILQDCQALTNIGLRSISLRLSQLKVLNLNKCILVDDIALTVVAAGCWHLEELYLDGCNKITDTGLSRVAQGLGPYLRVLDARGCTAVGEFGDRALQEIGQYCGNLEQFNFHHARRIEDPGLIRLVKGCPQLRQLTISGCSNVTKKSLRTMCKTLSKLEYLKIVGAKKLGDMDLDMLNGSRMQNTLTSLDLNSWNRLTDRGVGAVCKALGNTLNQLDLSNNAGITDYSSILIANLCGRLRELNLSSCAQITDSSVHSIAARLSCITCLKLDGNDRRVTTRALISHVGKELEFVDMAALWMGYKPKPAVEDLIRQREILRVQTKQAILIQSALRRKFAHRVYWERYRNMLLCVVIPMFQARVRGVLQRKKFTKVKDQIGQIRQIILIQRCWRKFFAQKERLRKVKKIRFEELQQLLAINIQRIYRAWKARKRVMQIRADLANKRLEEARKRARHETRAMTIQRLWRGSRDRALARRKVELRIQQELRRALEERMMRRVQRIAHGKIGRIRARQRAQEIADAELRWECSRKIQKTYRMRLGKVRWKRFWEELQLKIQNAAATTIQRQYRGYRGRILGAVARALKILRTRQHDNALLLQRVARGYVGRCQFAVHKELVLRRRHQFAMATVIERVFRGYKGREAAEIERELQQLDSKARPLILHLKHCEEDAAKKRKVIHNMEFYEQRSRDNLFEIERELEHVQKTTHKYTDSMRINDTPQRFLTKFLRVRLADFFEHEKELHRVKFIDLQSKRADLRDVEKDIMLTQRELIPLTTGLVADVKRRRTAKLRARVNLVRDSAKKVGKLKVLCWRVHFIFSSSLMESMGVVRHHRRPILPLATDFSKYANMFACVPCALLSITDQLFYPSSSLPPTIRCNDLYIYYILQTRSNVVHIRFRRLRGAPWCAWPAKTPMGPRGCQK